MHTQSLVALSADGLPIHYDVQGNGAMRWCLSTVGVATAAVGIGKSTPLRPPIPW